MAEYIPPFNGKSSLSGKKTSEVSLKPAGTAPSRAYYKRIIITGKRENARLIRINKRGALLADSLSGVIANPEAEPALWRRGPSMQA